MLRYRSDEDVKLVLDDSDTSVTYSGNWGTNGIYAASFQAYSSTMHHTSQPNVNASITFYGSYITVFGIIPSNNDLKHVGITSQVQTSYQFDDGPSEFFNSVVDAPQHITDQAFFQPSTTQSDGHHTLVITNLVGMLALDYFIVVPAESGSTYIQKIDDASPNITYNNANPFSNTIGADHNSTLHSLSSPQSTASLNFNGNFVAVYGALPVGNSLPNVSFTLDNVDQSDSSGSMPRLSASRKQWLSQVLFWKSSTMANGQHNLLITATQGEFLLDFILIQTSDSAGSGTTFSPQYFTSTTQYVPVPSSTKVPPYGNTTSFGSVSRSPPTSTGASSGHTKNTSVIVVAVGGAVGFVMLLLAVLYIIRTLSKRRSGLRSKTQSNPESPRVQATLPVTTSAMAGTPSLVDGNGQPVTFRLSLESVPPPYQPMGEPHQEQAVLAENERSRMR